MAALLLGAGARANGGPRPQRALERFGNEWSTPLHLSVGADGGGGDDDGRCDLVRLLLEHGADASAVDEREAPLRAEEGARRRAALLRPHTVEVVMPTARAPGAGGGGGRSGRRGADRPVGVAAARRGEPAREVAAGLSAYR